MAILTKKLPAAWFMAFLLLTVLSVAVLYGQETETPDAAQQALAATRGQQVYNGACAACHGRAGDGNGPAARYLDPLPRDFTTGIYKFRSTPSGQLPTDDDLFRTITNGIPRTMMPAWQDLLSEQVRRDVVAYIKTFSDKFQKMASGKPIQISSEPQMTAQTVSEGKSLYMLMECWACHGVSGKGDGKSANTLKDEWGHKIKPFNFTIGNYKGGNDHRSVFKTFTTGLNGTPMPSYSETFLFGGDSIEDFNNYLEVYSKNEVDELKAYLTKQPTEEQIGNMTEEQMKELIDRRSWSLVHYVKSLSKKAGVFYRLFAEDTEVTQ
ncbi:MAG: c-type cytochrome [bacterium]